MQGIETKHGVINEQRKEMQESIKSQLNLIKQSKVWRLPEAFRRSFSFKLSAGFTLLQRGMLSIKKEGFGSFLNKATAYLKSNKHLVTLGFVESDYERWMKKKKLTEERTETIRKEIAGFHYKPKISIIMPVHNMGQIWLEKAIDSVINQLYENWELCITDDASTKKHIKQTLECYLKTERRIKVTFLNKNHGISGASNEALSLATGEFIGLLDHDDELSIDALYEYVKLLNQFPKADLIYSDEDKIELNGKRVEPFFKPDYSPFLLLCRNYICHFCMVRKALINEVGKFRPGYEGAQDYDLILRCIEKTGPEKIFHVPKILYHWRKTPGSTAALTDAKPYAFDSAKKALSSYLNRNNIEGEVVDGRFLGSCRIKNKIINDYKISIVIPFRDQAQMLRVCLESILNKTTYGNYDIVLVNNSSEQSETYEYLNVVKDNPKIKIIEYNGAFNYSAITNYAVSQIESDYMIFLNNDTEIISKGWIEAMLEFGQRVDVGAVGALLYYPNDTIQHAGIIIGVGNVAGHSHKHFKRKSNGYYGRIQEVHNLSAVTAACMLTRRSVFEEVNGFDDNLSHAFNDVDYCLKIKERGYQIVYTPYAELYHHESLSRGYENSPDKRERFKNEIKYFQAKWKEVLEKGDPFYNPNLTLDKEDFSLRL